MRLRRVQQLIVIAALVLLCCSCYFLWKCSAARPWAVAVILLVLFGHAAILALEFLILLATRVNDPAPAAGGGRLVRAWFAEVCYAPVVFCWRQPFFSERWPNRLTGTVANQRGLLLVHGLVCNRGFWNPWLKRLTAISTPFVAVDLHPVFGPIDDHMQQIEEAVLQLERSTGLPPIVVAHSMGGLVVRKWWAAQAESNHEPSRLHHVVTLGTPHRGTWLARFGRSANALQMRQGSAWLSALAAAEPPGRAKHFTCFYSNCDNIVFPTSTAALPGADNRHLPGFGHVHMASAREPWDETLRRLST